MSKKQVASPINLLTSFSPNKNNQSQPLNLEKTRLDTYPVLGNINRIGLCSKNVYLNCYIKHFCPVIFFIQGIAISTGLPLVSWGLVSISVFFCQFGCLYLALSHHLDSSFFLSLRCD